MASTEQLSFDTKDRQRVYEYIRDHEPVDPDDLEDADLVSVTPKRSWQIVSILKRDGYVIEEEGRLRDAYRADEVESHAADDVEFTVRAARLEDLSGLAGVIRQVTAGKTYIVGERIDDQLSDVETLLHGPRDEPPMYFVALDGSEVVGWVNLDRPSGEKLRHVVALTMGLLDEYRGLGIGSALLERAVDWAAEHGFRKVASEVPSTNAPAIDFLEKHGWDVVATRPDHYLIEDRLVDEVQLDRWVA
jgi:ribosomal protein S18 acetylase RimI-like enzyme